MRRLLALAALLLDASHAQAQGIISEWGSVTPPPPPALAKVALDPGTTALLVLDLTQQSCQTKPRCLAMLPTVAKLIDHARSQKWTVIYTLGVTSMPKDILAPVAMQGEETLMVGPPDKFIGTDMRRTLKGKGIKTVVIVGTAAEGAVLHTAATAAFRGFDVVVPTDGMASNTPYAEQYVAWDLVNAPRLGDHVKLSAVAMIE